MTVTISIASVVWAVVALLCARQAFALASSVLAARHAQQADTAAIARELETLAVIVREHAPIIRDLRNDVTRLKNLEGID